MTLWSLPLREEKPWNDIQWISRCDQLVLGKLPLFTDIPAQKAALHCTALNRTALHFIALQYKILKQEDFRRTKFMPKSA